MEAHQEANYENAAEALEKLKWMIYKAEIAIQEGKPVGAVWSLVQLRFSQANFAFEGIEVV